MNQKTEIRKQITEVERLIEVEKNYLRREVLRSELKVLKLKLNKIY